MYVYIEFVIIDNLVITALIALISYRILRVSVSKKRVALASIIATIIAVFYPFIYAHFLLLLLLRIVVASILSLILFIKKAPILKGAIIFLLSTATLAGIIFMLGFIILGSANNALYSPFLEFPIGLFFLIPMLIYYPIKSLIKGVSKSRSTNEFYYNFEFIALDKKIKGKGFLDSGNFLSDDKSGLPVVVISSKLTLKILSQEQLFLIATNKGEQIQKEARYLNITTIGNNSKLLIIKAKKFKVYLDKSKNIMSEVMLGLSLNEIGQADALLSPLLINI
ncbi:MAG: sigma-E processing peptidase SpoIIGA [Firmicutes bacterium]|nr:sigma-E processing peptidase SpoIIGA [Bacillota bacterium]